MEPMDQSPAAPVPRILIAEDDALNRMLLEQALARLGFAVDGVGDGDEALRRHCARPYDLVLLDRHMPNCDGRSAAARLRAWERAEGRRAVPVVEVSGDGDGAPPAGFDAALSKPFRFDALHSLVRRLLAAPAGRVDA
jgi:CheY-like chemotaxis protein